jgi:type I restriction enzyme, S subunit
MKADLVRLGDELKIERIPVEIDPELEYTQIGIRSFGNGIFHRDKAPGNELGKLKYFEVHPERLIVSNIMAWEGAIAVSAVQDAGCIGSHRFLSYVPSSKIDIRYLNFYFQSDAGKAAIKETSTGTVLRNQTLSMKDFENLLVPLPELPEQHRIAVRLDSALSKKMRMQEMQAHCAGLRDSLRASLLGNAGPYRPLGEVLTEANDMVDVDLASAYPTAGVYGYGRGMFGRGPVLGTETSYSKLNRLHKNRLVMSRLKAFEGALAIIPSEFDGWFLSQEFPTFEVDETVTSVRYIAQLCAWPTFWSLLSAESKGLGARKERVSADRLLAVKVPLPALHDQKRISSVLDRVGVSQQLASHQESTINAFRKQLLHTAFSGQL